MGYPTPKELKQYTCDLFSLSNLTIFFKTFTAKNQIQPVSAQRLGNNFVHLKARYFFFLAYISYTIKTVKFKVIYCARRKILRLDLGILVLLPLHFAGFFGKLKKKLYYSRLKFIIGTF
jgi:hypothetical protein